MLADSSSSDDEIKFNPKASSSATIKPAPEQISVSRNAV